MPEGNPFDESPLNESCKSSDWTIDSLGSLRIYDEDEKWKCCGVMMNLSKADKQEGPLPHSAEMKFDDLINFRTLIFLV